MNKTNLAMLLSTILLLASFGSAAQEAATSLNGIWQNTDAEDLAFLTIIHKDDGSLAIISTNYVSILGIVEGYQSGASLGQADTSALGENIGSAMSYPPVFLGADLSFTIHRPAADELLIELTECSLPADSSVNCDQIYDNFPLNERVRHIRAF